ncbi:MAG: hydrogenase formation protein HypD [Tepidisphaeraceae bacterium]
MRHRVVESREALARLRAAAERLPAPVNFMEVCGTHTVSIFRSGLHSLMPSNVTLLSGPGCPVCVTSQGDIDQFIELALRPGVAFFTYGDMLRVTGSAGSLERARGQGADIHIIYSPMDAVKFAAANPSREVVFAAVGFETTTPATAVAILEAGKLGLANFTVLASHKLVIPAMLALLEGGQVNLNGFLCPGHVSIIIGYEAYRPIVEAASIARLTELAADGKPALENWYPQAVTAGGNKLAWNLIEKVLEPAEVSWRGVGMIPKSGMVIRPEYGRFDARVRYNLQPKEVPEPPGCRCGEVITGRCTPVECKLFGNVCTPINPIGPCMVSSEGTCQAWFKYHGNAGTQARRHAGTKGVGQ